MVSHQFKMNFVREVLASILNDEGKVQYNEPKFEKNPLGHIFWMHLKGVSPNLIAIKVAVLKDAEKKGLKQMSYSYRRAFPIHNQLMELAGVELTVDKFNQVCGKLVKK